MFETTLNIMGMQVPIKASPEDILGLANKAGIQIQPFAQAANSFAATLNRWFPTQPSTTEVTQAPAPALPTPTPAEALPQEVPLKEGEVRLHDGSVVTLEAILAEHTKVLEAQKPKTPDCVMCVRSNPPGAPTGPECLACLTIPARPNFAART